MNDFLFYLATFLSEAGISVAVVDNSIQGKLFDLIPGMETEGSSTYRGVEYRRNLDIKQEFYKDFAVVLVNTGIRVLHEKEFAGIYGEMEAWYVFLTPERKILEGLAQTFCEMKVPVTLYVRNFCEYKVTSSFLRNLWRENGGEYTGWHDIPFDQLDYEYRVRMEYEVLKEWKHLSRELERALLRTVGTLTGLGEKQQKKIYKRIKRGKKVCR